MTTLMIDESKPAQPTDFDPNEVRTIKAQLAVRYCDLRLTAEERSKCDAVALEQWWKHARSIAWCVQAGINETAKYSTPEPHFCHREACKGLRRCPRDPVCND